MPQTPAAADDKQVLSLFNSPVASADKFAEPAMSNLSGQAALSEVQEGKSENIEPFNKSDLSLLLQSEVLSELLGKYSEADLLNRPLKELLAEISAQSVGGPWVMSSDSDRQVLDAEFQLRSFQQAMSFITRMGYESMRCGHQPLSISLAQGETNWVLGYRLGSLSDTKLCSKDVRLAQYANYLQSAMETGDYDEYYSESENPLLQKETLSEELTEQKLQSVEVANLTVLSDGNVKIVKVPIARIGKWKHPEYGDLEFSQADFDSILQNFQENVLGYEPPLFLGHPVNIDTLEGHPAEGFLKEVSQEDTVLFGHFEVVNDSVYDDVDQGRYRYSSGEFIRNYRSKETGKSVGTILVGMALTNRPFLTKLPRVSALSDALDGQNQPIASVLEIQLTQPAMQTQPTTSATQTPAADGDAALLQLSEFKTAVAQQFSDLKEAYTQEIKGLKSEYEQKLSDANAQISSLAEKATFAEAELKKTRTEQKLAELHALTLPVEVKEKYSELIKAGTLGDTETEVFSMLKAMSQQTATAATTQAGTQSATHALNDSQVEDPYKAAISRNAELVKQKEQHLQSLLA